jgi:hypothetical protein
MIGHLASESTLEGDGLCRNAEVGLDERERTVLEVDIFTFP